MANINLNEAQQRQVSAWIEEGLRIAEIQKRIETEFGLRPTYMEVRFLLDDLKVMPKDPPAPPPEPAASGAAKPSPADPGLPTDAAAPETLPPAEPPPGAGHTKVTVDQIARPGALASGGVTFSDGQSGTWYLDQMGRLGLGMKDKNYRPSALDLEEFQIQLQQQLAKLGY